VFGSQGVHGCGAFVADRSRGKLAHGIIAQEAVQMRLVHGCKKVKMLH
jgi:hypothetical protein